MLRLRQGLTPVRASCFPLFSHCLWSTFPRAMGAVVYTEEVLRESRRVKVSLRSQGAEDTAAISQVGTPCRSGNTCSHSSKGVGKQAALHSCSKCCLTLKWHAIASHVLCLCRFMCVLWVRVRLACVSLSFRVFLTCAALWWRRAPQCQLLHHPRGGLPHLEGEAVDCFIS